MGQILPYGHVIFEPSEVIDVKLIEITRTLYFKTPVLKTPNKSTAYVH
jgi:hypothetical protein